MTDMYSIGNHDDTGTPITNGENENEISFRIMDPGLNPSRQLPRRVK